MRRKTMNRRIGPICLILAIGLSGSVEAFERTAIGKDQVDLSILLPPPPKPGSVEQAADEAAVIAFEKLRTPEQAAKAVEDNKITVFRFADVLGLNFTQEKLPITSKFFEDVIAAQRAVVLPTKDVWNRLRPFAVLPGLHAIGELPTNGSYPSGHA